MPMLQVVTPKMGPWEYHPISIDPSIVVSVVYIRPTDLLGNPVIDSDENSISAVTLKQDVCVYTEPGDFHKPIMRNTLLVAGHFQEIAILFGLDEDGAIQDDIDSQPT